MHGFSDGSSGGSSRRFSGSDSGTSGSVKGGRHYGASSGGEFKQHGGGSSSSLRRGSGSDSGGGSPRVSGIDGNKGGRGHDGVKLNERHTGDARHSDGDFRGNRHDGDGGRHTAGFRGHDDGGRHDGNWDRHGGNGNWNNNGWNGHRHNRHNHWHHGFWGWGGFGYRPWWGFGWGSGFGYPLVGLGIGFGPWGYNPYFYGGWNYWGYSPWGYDAYYYNPYCVAPLVIGTTVVDYSQPLMLASPTDSPADSAANATDTAPAPEDADPQTVAAMASFEQARHAFRNGDYTAALDAVHRAIEKLPSDAALHEFRGLVLFAQGNYQEAAATIHAVLAGGPGWDWETMSSLYPSVSVYTAHLRALESYARANPESADARFLLGYHYLTEGYQEAGLRQFQKVVELKPDDALAQRILDSAKPDSTAEGTPTPPAAGLSESTSGDQIEAPPELPAPAGTETATASHTSAKPTVEQLTGTWKAANDKGATFELTLATDNTFTWQFTEQEQTKSLTGKYTIADDLLVLEPQTGPPMIGRVSDLADNAFKFRILGTAEADPGLTFSR